MNNYIVIGIVAVVIIALSIWYYLSHAKTSRKKVVKSGIDLVRLCEALGGKANIKSVSANGSKVIFILDNVQKASSENLQVLGASGIVVSKDKLMVIFGKASEALASEINQELS